MADHPLTQALTPHAKPLPDIPVHATPPKRRVKRPPMTAAQRECRNPLNEHGRPMCDAISKHSPTGRCRTDKLGPVGLNGYRRCRMHGGFAAVGPANPAYKSGAYSKAMPAGPIREAYERHLANPELLSLKNEMAMVKGEIERVVMGLSTGHVKALPGAVQSVELALRARDPAGLSMALDQLKAEVQGAATEAASVDRLVQLRTHLARLARTEHLRNITEATMIDAAAAWALVYAVIELVRSHVADPGSRQAIVEGLVRLTGRDALPRAGGRLHAG